MNLILSEIKQLISETNMDCDARKTFFDFIISSDDKTKLKYIEDFFRVRNMRIVPTEPYLNIVFVDTETGEQLEMNCKRGVHNLCMKRKIYPPIILVPLIKYQQTNK